MQELLSERCYLKLYVRDLMTFAFALRTLLARLKNSSNVLSAFLSNANSWESSCSTSNFIRTKQTGWWVGECFFWYWLTRVNRHLTLMQIRTDAACPLCQEDEETVLHFLGECSVLYLLNT